MPSPKAKPAKETAPSSDEERLHWLQVRRRLTGAAAVCLALAIIWQLGDVKPPPSSEPASPPEQQLTLPQPAPELQDARKRLEETRSSIPAAGFVNDDTSDDTPTSDGDAINTDDAGGLGGVFENVPVYKVIDNLTEEDLEDSNNDFLSLFKDHFTNDEEDEAKQEAQEQEEAKKESESTEDSDTAQVQDNLAVEQSPYVVQIGAFREHKRALRVVKHLRGQDYKMIIEELSRNGETLYRVRASGYSSRANAELARRSIAKLGYKSSQVLDTQ